jgi:hypothetical protein
MSCGHAVLQSLSHPLTQSPSFPLAPFLLSFNQFFKSRLCQDTEGSITYFFKNFSDLTCGFIFAEFARAVRVF